MARPLASNLSKDFSARQRPCCILPAYRQGSWMMIFRAIFWVGVVALLMPHEPILAWAVRAPALSSSPYPPQAFHGRHPSRIALRQARRSLWHRPVFAGFVSGQGHPRPGRREGRHRRQPPGARRKPSALPTAGLPSSDFDRPAFWSFCGMRTCGGLAEIAARPRATFGTAVGAEKLPRGGDETGAALSRPGSVFSSMSWG